MKVTVVKSKNEFLNNIKSNKINIIIWDGKEEIDELLEEIGEELPDKVKLTLKICEEVKFKRPVTVNIKGRETFKAKKLSDILKQVDEITPEDIEIIVESNDKKEALEIIQQLIYIEREAGVYTRKEILEKNIVEEVLNRKKNLEKLIGESINKIEKTKPVKKLSRKYKSEILSILNNMKTELREIEDLTIKVAVFATKKTGKSMIVNALLGEEYAPTSQELATPNIIIYKPHDGKNIILEYKNTKYRFSNTADLKRYIKEEFKKVNKAGKKLPEMTIYYPKKRFINFEIYDTPGPDLAKSEHYEPFEKAVELTDVAIFAIDYTKHLQESEEELLRKVKEICDKKGKSYSFICVINKIDMMYIDTDVEKIKTRVASFIKSKLKELKFDNFVVIPITALIYFYLQKLSLIREDIKNVNDLREFLYNLENDFDFMDSLTQEENTIFSVVNSFVGKIKNIYRIREVKFDDINKATGFPIFERYLKYITMNKALTEKILEKIINIDTLVTKIDNYLSLRNTLSKEAKQIKEAIDEFLTETKNRGIEKEFKKSLKEIEEDYYKKTEKITNKTLSSLKKNIKEEVDYVISTIIESFKEDAKALSKSEEGFINFDLYDLVNFKDDHKRIFKIAGSVIRKEINVRKKRNAFVKRYKEINIQVDKDRLNTFVKKIVDEHSSELMGFLDKISKEYEEKYNRTKSSFEEAIEKLNSKLNKSFKGDFEKIKLPSVDLSLNVEGLKERLEEIARKVGIAETIKIDEKVFDEIIQGGFFRWLSSFFGEDRYEVDIDKAIKILQEERKKALEKLDREINNLKDFIEGIFRDIDREFNNKIRTLEELTENFIKSIFEPVENIRSTLEEEKETKEDIINFLNEVENAWKKYSKDWNGIVGKLKK